MNVRVLIAPDCFTGSLSAPEAAAAIARGWHRYDPAAELTLMPMADGGPGFVAALAEQSDTTLVAITGYGPLGPEQVLEVEVAVRRAANEPVTIFVEAAQSCGSHLVPDTHRDPTRTSTAGLGALLADCLEQIEGVQRVVVGIGGTGTNDAGMGLLAALARALPEAEDLPSTLERGGGALAGLTSADLEPLMSLKHAWDQRGVELVVATDVDSPLVGLKGATRVFGPQKGATEAQIEILEAAICDVALAAVQVLGLPQSVVVRPGAGAGGGLGFAFDLLGAQTVPGVDAVAQARGLTAAAAEHDLVVTGEGCLDWQSLAGKVIAGVARAAADHGRPTIALVGQLQVGKRELMSIGVDAAYPLVTKEEDVPAAIADAGPRLEDLAARIARTWSPRATN